MYRATYARVRTTPLLSISLTPIALGLSLALGLEAPVFAAEPTLPKVKVSADAESDYKPAEPASPRFTQPLLDTPQTVTIVPKAVIEERAATTLRDVLRNVSGISMQAGEGGTPAGDQLSIRGFAARTDIFVDNVRDFGGYTRDPFNLEQVEIVKGPSSDYSGRGSTGGSINLVSKAPYADDFTTAGIGLGTDAYKRTTLDVNRLLPGTDDAAVRLNLMYHDQDVAGRDEVENKRYGIAPSIAFGLDSPTSVTLSLFHMYQDNVPDYGVPWVPDTNTVLADYANRPPPVDYSNWYGLKARDFEETRTTLATAEIRHSLTDNLRLRNMTRWGMTERDSVITAPRFASTDSTDIRRSDVKDRDQEDTIISNITDLTLDLTAGGMKHTLLAGFEASMEKEKRSTQEKTGPDSPATDLFNPNPNDPYLENLQHTGGASDADSRSLAAYVSDSIQVNDHWQVNGGVRWDRFKLEYRPDGVPEMKRTDNMLSYRAGLVYKPVREGSIYLGYGTSFNPSTEGLSISTSSNQPGIADLKPEKNRSMELGTKWELMSRQLLLTAAVFRTEKTNARTQNPDDPNDLLVLDGEQLVQGVELGLAGSLTSRWDIFTGYTFLDSEIEKSKDPAELGNELPNTPKHSFNIWSTYQVTPKLQIGGGALYVGDRYSNTSNIREAPDYTVYEAMAGYQVNRNLDLRLNVQNLTDKKYIDFVGGGHFIPGVGRTVLLTTSVRF
jgi:catecholate siderophore receptor